MKACTKQKLLLSLASLPFFGALCTALTYSQLPRFPVEHTLLMHAALFLDIFWKVLAVPGLIMADTLVQLIGAGKTAPDMIQISLLALALFLAWLAVILVESAHPTVVMIAIALWTLLGGGLTFAFIIAGI